MKIKKINEAFNNELNYLAENGVLPLEGKISEEGVKALNDELNKSIEFAYINEALDDKNSLNAHYSKHVMKQNEKRSSKNRGKYDYMIKDEYYKYATLIANKKPTFIIDTSITDKDEVDSIIDDYNTATNAVLMIDYNLLNNYNNEPMIAVFNKPSKYSKFSELCLVEKKSGIPITIYALPGTSFFKAVVKFLS